MQYSEKLYQKASNKYRDGNYDLALEDVENCLNSLRKTAILNRKRDGDDFKRYIDAKILQGRIYHTLGLETELDNTMDSLKSLAIGSGNSSTYIRGKINYFHHEVLSDQGKHDEALEELIEAKNSFISSENFQDAIEILFDLENFPQYRVDADKLLDLYKEILEINKQLSDKNVRKINSGRTRFQIAKVLRRTDEKKSRKSIIVAYNELMESPSLYLESLYYLAEMYMRQSPNKAVEIIQKIKENASNDYHKLRSRILENIVHVIEEKENDLDWSPILDNISNITIDLSLADNILDAIRYLIIYGSEENHTVALNLIEEIKQVYDQRNDRIGKTLTYLFEGLVCDISEADSKLNLVEIYAKGIKEDHSTYLRSISLDLAHWIKLSEPAEEIIKDIKQVYSDDSVIQAETLAIIGIYLERKQTEDNKIFLEEAKNIFKGTSLKSHQNLEKFKKITA